MDFSCGRVARNIGIVACLVERASWLLGNEQAKKPKLL